MGKKTSTALATAPTTALEPWEQKLMDDAEKAAGKVEGIGGGAFASIRGGRLKIGGNAVPNSEVACIILAHTNAKSYYTSEEFDPDEKVAPVCYAFGDNIKALVPHADSPDKQCGSCADCPHNVFGTSTKGKKRGKRCKDQIRLSFIPGGTLEKDGSFTAETNAKALKDSEAVKLGVPATSSSALAAYVRALSDGSHRPPYAVYSLIKVEPDDTVQVRVSFNNLGNVDKDLVEMLRKRSEAAEGDLALPYPKNDAKPVQAAKGRPKKDKLQ